MDKVSDVDALLRLLDKVPDADLLLKLVDKVTDTAQLERLLASFDKAEDLEKLLQHMTPTEIENFINDLGDLAKFKEIAAKYGGDALKHYGAAFFKDFKGVDASVMDHLKNFGGVDKKKGIIGCHDDAMFMHELKGVPPEGVTSPPPGVGRGEIVSSTPHPSEADIVRHEYGFWQQDGKGNLVSPLTLKAATYLKTTFKGLTSNAGKWHASALEAVEESIRSLKFPKGDGSFQGIAGSGLEWEGWYRGGKVDTVYIIGF